MNREEVIALAQQAGFGFPKDYDLTEFMRRLERFADFIAAAEREECAIAGGAAAMAGLSHVEVAAAIRARGEQ